VKNLCNYLYGAHVRANGIRQHYLRFGGNGAPIVIVPGVVTPAVLWMAVADRLGALFDVYVLDVRGRGLSESGPHLDYGFDACADDLQAFLEAVGLFKVTVIGHSMGGRIGLRLVRRPQHNVQKLVMLDPPASGPGRRPYPIPIEGSIQLVNAAQRGEAEALLRSGNRAVWPEPLLRLRAEWLSTCDIRAAEVAYRDFHEQDPYEDMAAAACDSIVLVVAAGSGVILEDDIQDFRQVNPRLRVHAIPGAAHQLQVENFAELMSVLEALLDA